MKFLIFKNCSPLFIFYHFHHYSSTLVLLPTYQQPDTEWDGSKPVIITFHFPATVSMEPRHHPSAAKLKITPQPARKRCGAKSDCFDHIRIEVAVSGIALPHTQCLTLRHRYWLCRWPRLHEACVSGDIAVYPKDNRTIRISLAVQMPSPDRRPVQ